MNQGDGELRKLTESEQAVAVVCALARHCRPYYVQPVSNLLHVFSNTVMWDLYSFLTGLSSDHGRQSGWSSLSHALQSRYGNKGHASIRDWLVGHVWMNVAYYFNDDGQEFVAKKIYDELKCLQSGQFGGGDYCIYKPARVDSNGVSNDQTHIYFGSTHVMYGGDHSRLGFGSAGSIRAGEAVYSDDTGSNQGVAEVALKSLELCGGDRLGRLATQYRMRQATYKGLLMEWSAHYMPHEQVVRMDDLFLYRKEVNGRSVDKAKLLLPRCHDVGHRNDLTQNREWYLSEIKGVLQAVKQMHFYGWAHGDIKFGNMLRDTQDGVDRLVLSDFDCMTPLVSPAKLSTYLSPLISHVRGTAEQLDVFQLALVLAQIVNPQFDIERFVYRAVKMTPDDYRGFLDSLDPDLLFLKPALSVSSSSPCTIDQLIQDFNNWYATQDSTSVQKELQSTSSTDCSNASTVSSRSSSGEPAKLSSSLVSDVSSRQGLAPSPAPVYPPPAQAYPPPAQAYPPPAQAPAYGAQVYSAPAPVYSAPAPVYSAPAPVYTQAQSYGVSLYTPAQAPAYGAQVYSAPVQSYGAPVYSVPAPVYSVPVQSYGAPAQFYSAPAPVYYAPAYSTPVQSYGAQVYSPPAPAYFAPAQIYSAPVQSYGAPVYPPSAPTYYAPAQVWIR
ncbi:hypothetical protein EBZ35_01805 [bacterium]|nr:hypothetical protein [bacterium]